ncbi:Protein fmp32, mitochondrial [Polyrhizophydium stewartii]|uniref:Protein fmp32, mitochondrial n=1 Tax=Polyrhizophydium stewartii TaxID=2732419 RepID=A0ABR4NGL7_9FUNG
MSRSSVTKAEFEKALYMSRVDFTQLRSEIQMLEKNEFALLRADIGRLSVELEKLRVRMAEDLRRVQSNVRLELSLDKGRIRDDQSAKEIRLKEADSKIDTEVSNLRTQMETIQWELFKTLFPLFCAAGALFFSYLRFVK